MTGENLAMGGRHRLHVASTWDGACAAVHERVCLTLWAGAQLHIRIDAPWHGDPAPHGTGSTPRLWEFEVVELMLLGDDRHYLELEFGPHGHYLALRLHGRRRVVEQGMDLVYHAVRNDKRWGGEATVPLDWVPAGPTLVNAFAIHGQGAARRYLAWRPPGGSEPDFHRLDSFAALGDATQF